MDSIQFFFLKNTVKTNQIQLLKDLISLKCLYSKQLARMPRQYLVKLLFDGVHESLIIKMNNKIVAGITFRGFQKQFFYQIAFLAVNNQNQCGGLGSKIMSKFKNYCQQNQISHIFTFADDGAIGFFEKQGFTKNISLPQSQYKSYIKQYIGGQMMECKIDLSKKIDFQKLRYQIKHVKNDIIYNKVKSLLYLAPYQMQKTQRIIFSKLNQLKTLDELAEWVPGLSQAGYTKDKYIELDKKLNLPFLLYCQHFIELASNKSSYLKQGMQEEIINYKSKEYKQQQRRIKILHDYEYLLYKLERKLLMCHFKYKDEFIEYFTDQLKSILVLDQKLKPNQKEFLAKINQLKYEFMRNLISYQLKTKKINAQTQQKK